MENRGGGEKKIHNTSHLLPGNQEGNKDGCNSNSGLMSQNVLPLAGGLRPHCDAGCRTGPPPPVCSAVLCMSNVPRVCESVMQAAGSNRKEESKRSGADDVAMTVWV